MEGYLYQIRRDGRFGYIDAVGNVVVEPTFKWVGDFAEGLGYCVTKKRRKQFVEIIDVTTAVVGSFQTNDVLRSFSSGYLAHSMDEKYGAVDRTGATVIPPEYDSLSCTNGKFVLKRNGKYGIYSPDSGWLISPKYDWLMMSADSDFVTAVLGNKFIIINTDDERIFDREFAQAGIFGEEYLAVRLDVHSKWGWINTSGEIVVDCLFDNIWASFVEGTNCVRVGRKWGIVDVCGHYILEPQYDSIGKLSNGLRNYATGGIPLQFEGTFDKAKWGFLDREGNVAIEAAYSGVCDFAGECTVVFEKVFETGPKLTRKRVINRQGKTICIWT